jgi:hypothetical protein
MTRHQHWLATQAIKTNFERIVTRMNEGFNYYEGRLQEQPSEMNKKLQDIKDFIANLGRHRLNRSTSSSSS